MAVPGRLRKYTRRLADVNWSYGSLVTPETPAEPESLGEDDSIAALLDAAEDIINDAVPGTLADLEEERATRKKKGLGRLRRGKGDGVEKGSQPPGGRARKSKGDGLGERLRKRYRDGRR